MCKQFSEKVNDIQLAVFRVSFSTQKDAPKRTTGTDDALTSWEKYQVQKL